MGNQDFDTAQFLESFIEVGRERLVKLEKGLLGLEKDAQDRALVQELLREAHTFKGEARMLGLEESSEEAHKLEDLLIDLRDGRREGATLMDELFRKIEALRGLLDGMGPKDEDGDGEGARPETVRVKTDLLERISGLSLEAVFAFRQIEVNNARLRRLYGASIGIKKKWTEINRRMKKGRIGHHEAGELDEFQHRLTTFFDSMRLIWADTEAILGAQSEITEQLIAQTLSSKMRPLSTIFDAFPGQVRNMASEIGVKVNFEIKGGEIELDKGIIEELNEPLVHLIRNALDHGLEKPAVRDGKGKPMEGRVTLRALQKGQNVLIELEDDGKGLDIREVREKALEKGIIVHETTDTGAVTDEVPQAILDIIFSSGFTTKKGVSTISGRGIGLDAVKHIVDKLNGAVRLYSTPGKGTRFVLELPLTTALMPVLLIRAGGRLFALPTQWVDRVVKIVKKDLKLLNGQGQIRLDNHLLSLVDLSQAVGFQPPSSEVSESPLVIMRQNQQQCALRVEELVDQGNVIVKALPKYVETRLIIGVTVLEDGSVSLILNAPELFGSVYTETRLQMDTVQTKRRMETKVLAVDDAVITRTLLRNILLSAGYDVTIATNGIEAMEKLSGARFDIILTDVEMPHMDGIELTRRAKDHEVFKNIPIVILSSHESSDHRMKGLEAGADAYLPKSSFSQRTLIETIERLAGQ